MPDAFIPKSRRIRFALSLRIHDLNNVPLVSGTSFITWHLPSSTAAEHRGRTPKHAIKDHRVVYDYTKQMDVRLSIGKDGMLQSCEVHFEVIQEYSSGGRAERIRLGDVKLNLAEYCGSEADSPVPGIVRRYLMQDSKINSTLKIGIHMRHIEGTRDYYAPALRTAPVFGGIAGIISSSEPASATHGVATTSRELGEMQDMYRRTLAAYWASQPGELKADECIEDIFAGGDGWGKNGRPPNVSAPGHEHSSQPGSGSSTPAQDGHEDVSRAGKTSRSDRHTISLGGGKHMGYGKHGARHSTMQTPRKIPGEIDEFDIREDLRSWTVSERAFT
ncbi:hypothetical protein BAUCODRAFT_61232 [Baudoinia panamericana UAMH 10762]|uniref:C2 NT-type domain-containing protein n=1 Tax=Baudoinia panamericana (strain UAMH 10762) TaxID=717646 RepID=M2NM43_BAUPA|nr:uncharacterized protein BAUCODRAFT_61232 [Baudoinia panamericana UAMH 10762]EMD00565.1 hypothetical protein BAUCODRAFT_61232 [Baudoinia panamericana UAMH 10762]